MSDFESGMSKNVHTETVSGFGDEWERFNQRTLSAEERARIFKKYFSIFPWNDLPENAEGFDLGCGSGRWAMLVAPRVGKLICIDPSAALAVAEKSLSSYTNCSFVSATVDTMPIEDGTMDFGYSLGVMHHVPDTQAGIATAVKKLKPGAPLLLYIYYAFDNRPFWFHAIWRISEIFRAVISRMPMGMRYWASQFLASTVYWPLARTSRLLEKTGLNVSNIPLSTYRNLSFYTMRTDALDRFGTRLEQRFSRKQIKQMMEQAGLENIVFSPSEPFWCAVGTRRKPE
jgi:ubiquinone/menaquinone biosynthesis C-methylase UbiE